MRRHLSDRLREIRLHDAYGQLLTERQQHLLRLYLHDDLSLSEIAERLAVTRQAVYDALRRSTDELERIEAVLQMVEAADAAARRSRTLADRFAALEASLRRLAARFGPQAVGEVLDEVAALRRAAR